MIRRFSHKLTNGGGNVGGHGVEIYDCDNNLVAVLTTAGESYDFVYTENDIGYKDYVIIWALDVGAKVSISQSNASAHMIAWIGEGSTLGMGDVGIYEFIDTVNPLRGSAQLAMETIKFTVTLLN
jgi:hypothetical protein